MKINGTCRYCKQEMSAGYLDILDSTGSAGYIYNHCDKEREHREKEYAKDAKRLRENMIAAEKSWHKMMDYEIALLNSKK